MNMPKSPSLHIPDDLIFEYLDQALPAERHSEIHAHLESCSTCQQRLSEFSSLFDTLEDLPDQLLEHDLSPAVLTAIKRKPGFSGILWWLLAIQGALSLGLVGIIAPSIRFPRNGEILVFEIIAELSTRINEWLISFSNIQQRVVQLLTPGIPISLNISTQSMILLLLLASITWIIGNSILLRPQPDRK